MQWQTIEQFHKQVAAQGLYVFVELKELDSKLVASYACTWEYLDAEGLDDPNKPWYDYESAEVHERPALSDITHFCFLPFGRSDVGGSRAIGALPEGMSQAHVAMGAHLVPLDSPAVYWAWQGSRAVITAVHGDGSVQLDITPWSDRIGYPSMEAVLKEWRPITSADVEKRLAERVQGIEQPLVGRVDENVPLFTARDRQLFTAGERKLWLSVLARSHGFVTSADRTVQRYRESFQVPPLEVGTVLILASDDPPLPAGYTIAARIVSVEPGGEVTVSVDIASPAGGLQTATQTYPTQLELLRKWQLAP